MRKRILGNVRTVLTSQVRVSVQSLSEMQILSQNNTTSATFSACPLSDTFCNPSSSNSLTPFPSNLSYISNSLSSLDSPGRERYGDLASFFAVAVTAGVDVEVEGAESRPVAQLAAAVVGTEGVLSSPDKTVGSLVPFHVLQPY